MAVIAPRLRKPRATGAQPVPLGKFVGGMVTVGELNTLADNQLALLTNMEVDTDGSLVTRPPISTESAGNPNLQVQPLGYVTRVADGETFLVVAYPSANTTYLYQLSSKVFSQIASFAASGMLEYDNKVVLCQLGGAGGYWDLATAAWTATASMPAAQQIVFFLGRFWAFGAKGSANQTTVWFSKLTVPTVSTIYDWAVSSDFFTVNAGDGQWITGVIADPSGLIILKNASTFRFTYSTSPAGGILATLSTTVGADNLYAFTANENYYFVFCNGILYQMLQGKYYPLSTRKIAFSGRSAPSALQYNVRVSLFGQRVMVWFYGALYVLNLVSQTWSTWEAASWPGHFFMAPAQVTGSGGRTAIAVTGLQDNSLRKLWRVTETAALTGATETFTWKVRTKAYDFGGPSVYKRLMFWTANLRTATAITATAYPIDVPQDTVTFDDLDTLTTDQLDLGSWDDPMVRLISAADTVTFPTSAPVQVQIKLRAALRFLVAYFELTGAVDGTAASWPARLYGVTPYLRSEATTSEKVS